MLSQANTGRRYRPRRTRSGTPPPFRLTPRDIDIVGLLAEHRFLNSGQICGLVDGSPKNIRNRLKGLFELGLLDRPECQYDVYRPGGGSSLAVYALADKGARLLARKGRLTDVVRRTHAQNNRRIGRPFLEHELLVADLAVALHVAIRDRARDRARPGIDLIDGARFLSTLPPATRSRARPFRLTTALIHRAARHSLAVEPDHVFTLVQAARKHRAHYLIEIDRGTMPIERSDLGASSILRKFLAYQQLWRTKAHTTQFGWRNFRVLVITSDATRARNMRDCLRRHTAGQGSPLFWFADRTILKAPDLLRATWSDGQGRSRSLDPDRTDNSAD